MELTGVSMQVLSTVPALGFNYNLPVEYALEIAQFLNDHIGGICQRWPDKFVGLCTIPLQDPHVALTELARCMRIFEKKEKNLSDSNATVVPFKGVQIGSNIDGKPLGDLSFDIFWKTIEEWQVPVFIHPWDMSTKEFRFSEYWFPWYSHYSCDDQLIFLRLG